MESLELLLIEDSASIIKFSDAVDLFPTEEEMFAIDYWDRFLIIIQCDSFMCIFVMKLSIKALLSCLKLILLSL